MLQINKANYESMKWHKENPNLSTWKLYVLEFKSWERLPFLSTATLFQCRKKNINEITQFMLGIKETKWMIHKSIKWT